MSYKFEFSEQMTNDIAAALGNAPYRLAAPIISEMERQIQAQQREVVPPLGSNGDGQQLPNKI